MRSFSVNVSDYLQNENGATAIEYALLASLIGIALIAGASAMVGSIDSMFKDVDSELVLAAYFPRTFDSWCHLICRWIRHVRIWLDGRWRF